MMLIWNGSALSVPLVQRSKWHMGASDGAPALYNSQVNRTEIMRTTYMPLDKLTVTMTEAQWSTIRTAVLCLAVDERIKGNSGDADYYLKAYYDLKEAMGMDA